MFVLRYMEIFFEFNMYSGLLPSIHRYYTKNSVHRGTSNFKKFQESISPNPIKIRKLTKTEISIA